LTFLRFGMLSSVVLLALPAFAQVGQPLPGLPQTPPSTQPAALPPPPPPAKNVPDYPEPRTLTFGAFYWDTGPGTSPNIYGGQAAIEYSTLIDLGRAERTPGFEAFMPISRTGEIHVEGWKTGGDANQLAPAIVYPFGQPYAQGTYLATYYKITNAKIYLDDLLFPHKFPVSKFRLKSLWEFDWTSTHSSIDAPILDAQTGVANIGTGQRQIFYPEFGIAAEYALTRHILLRASVAGFGFPHHADIADAEATLGFRHGSWEVRGGAKAFHFKTSPTNSEYVVGTLAGAFIDLRWHWSL
jgi:hypothetical protein